MTEAFNDSDDEFVEFEEDDGEIVVIKSCSQLLREAKDELERRQEQINMLNQNVSKMQDQIKTLGEELTFYRNIYMNTQNTEQIFPRTQFDAGSLASIAASEIEPTPDSSISCPSTYCGELVGGTVSVSDSMEDFDILSNDKSCQTENIIVIRKKHKATQTRFEKKPFGIFQGGLLETSSESQDASKLIGQRSSSKVSLSNALGWSSAFKEVGLNMICHLKQTMDPFNIACSLDNETTIKEFENILDDRIKVKNTSKSSTPVTTVSIDQVMSDGNANRKTLVMCPYCNEEMDSCSIQRHIQSMCGALEFLPIY